MKPKRTATSSNSSVASAKRKAPTITAEQAEKLKKLITQDRSDASVKREKLLAKHDFLNTGDRHKFLAVPALNYDWIELHYHKFELQFSPLDAPMLKAAKVPRRLRLGGCATFGGYKPLDLYVTGYVTEMGFLANDCYKLDSCDSPVHLHNLHLSMCLLAGVGFKTINSLGDLTTETVNRDRPNAACATVTDVCAGLGLDLREIHIVNVDSRKVVKTASPRAANF